MYISDNVGGLVQLSQQFQDDDELAEEEMKGDKYMTQPTPMFPQRQSAEFGGDFRVESVAMKQHILEDEDEIQSQTDLGQIQRPLPSFDFHTSQKQLFEELQTQPQLQELLDGLPFGSLTDEEMTMLAVWSRPLIQTYAAMHKDEFAARARTILGVDGVQVQGLLRNCEPGKDFRKEAHNNLIKVVEGYYALQKHLPDDDYLRLLRNAVYSEAKALEVRKTLQDLSHNWLSFKESINRLRTNTGPRVASKMLQKPQIVNVKTHDLKQSQDVEILLKLLPYFDVALNEKGKESPDSKQLRLLLGISKPEADMIARKKGVNTLIQLISVYFDGLVTPSFAQSVVQELTPCFFNSTQKASNFCSVLQRVLWEYHQINKTFVANYKVLSNINRPTKLTKEIPPEVLIFGGLPLTCSQVNAIAQLVNKHHAVRGFSLYSTRIRNEGLICLARVLKQQTNYKAIRIHDRRLYSLDVTDNLVDGDGIKSLYELFYDQFRTTGTVFEMEAPIPTSIRILVLDYNLIGKTGADWLGKILDVSRQLKVLSLESCGLEGKDIEGFCKALQKNKLLKVLNLGQNRIGDLGMDHLCDALCDNTALEYLDLFDSWFANLGGTYLDHTLKRNRSLRWLRIANTQVNLEVAELVINAALESRSLVSFRWVNLLPIRTEYFERSTFSKLMVVESRVNPVSRKSFANPKIGDLAFSLLCDIYKSQYWYKTGLPVNDAELQELLQSYANYLIEHWEKLQQGLFDSLTNRPEVTYKALVTEEIVAQSAHLDQGQKAIKSSQDTLAKTPFKVPVKAGQGQSSKPLMGADQTFSGIEGRLQLPDFKMREFSHNSAMTKHTSLELLQILIQHGLDVNYQTSPHDIPMLMSAVQLNLPQLFTAMMSQGFADAGLDPEVGPIAPALREVSVLHMLALNHDTRMLKSILEFKANFRRRMDLDLRDSKDRNASDIAIEVGNQRALDLLLQHGLSPSKSHSMETLKGNQNKPMRN